MLLKKVFLPVKSMEAEEAKEYIASHREGEFTLLDVRQPWEYEEAHIAGARLMPLPQLANSYKELNPEKPVIVHCAVGGRSRVAAQLLSGLGFKEVYNLAGGIVAYQGRKATGPRELNLDLIRGDETSIEMMALAYGMEKALAAFYETLEGKARDQEVKDLFSRLVRVEQRHQQRLMELYEEQTGKPAREFFPDPKNAEVLEGGFRPAEFMAANEPYLTTVPRVLEVAMILETQALDLYLRFAQRSTQPQTREVLLSLGEEEKLHLGWLARLWEEKSGKGG